MTEYKYNKKENKFTENGHTMFEVDVLMRLKRLAFLEDKIGLCKYTSVDMDNAYDKGFKDGNQRDLTGSLIEILK